MQPHPTAAELAGVNLSRAGEGVPARPAATVILLRNPFEVLMVRRNPALAFMGGFWVFPGGKVEPADDSPEAAARRELGEEVSIDLAAEAELIPFARWITPVGLPKRYDTWFFLGHAGEPADTADAIIDGSEIVDLRWIAPLTALEDGSPLAFPTRKQLERLSVYPDASAAMAANRGRPVTPILPVIVHDDGSPAIVVPEDPAVS